MSWTLGAGLAGANVLVTGASGGIGAEVCAAFGTAEANVAAVDVRAPNAVVSGLPGPGRHHALTTDLRNPAAIEPLVDDVRGRLGGIDVLAHVAAVLVRRGDIEQVTEEDWALQEEVNLRATFFLDRAVARVMRAQGRGGRIVNFTSQAWWSGGFGGSVVYAATKGGIVSMTRGLARTYGPDGITVNCVAPAAVNTPMLLDGLGDDEVEAFRSQIPLGRFAEPSEIAGSVVFLASEHAGYITGATLNMSGGQLMY